MNPIIRLQISTLDPSDGSGCWRRFASNRDLGLIFFLAIVMGNLVKEDQEETSPNHELQLVS